MPKWSDHALERWQERFPNTDRDFAYANARRVGRKVKAKIKRSCPVESRRWMSHGFMGRYFLINRDGIVFVMAAPETVITVLYLPR